MFLGQDKDNLISDGKIKEKKQRLKRQSLPMPQADRCTASLQISLRSAILAASSPSLLPTPGLLNSEAT